MAVHISSMNPKDSADVVLAHLMSCVQSLIILKNATDAFNEATDAVNRDLLDTAKVARHEETVQELGRLLDILQQVNPSHRPLIGASLGVTAAALKPHVIDLRRLIVIARGVPAEGEHAREYEGHREQVWRLKNELHRQLFPEVQAAVPTPSTDPIAASGIDPLTALRLLAYSAIWRITRLPRQIGLDMLRLLDTDGFLEVRPWMFHNPTTDPRDPKPLMATPSSLGWLSPVAKPQLAGTWEVLFNAGRRESRTACEVSVTERGLAEITRAGVRALDSAAALLNELDSFNPPLLISMVGRIHAGRDLPPPADAFEDDVRRAWARALALREANPALPTLPNPVEKYADRYLQLKDWCIEAMKFESWSESGTGQDAIGTPEQIGFITQQVLDIFEFAYAHSGVNVALAEEADIESFGRSREHISLKLRALRTIGEGRGLDMSPLSDIGTRWHTLWRGYPDAAQALRNFQSVIPENMTIDAFRRTITRLRDQAQSRVQLAERADGPPAKPIDEASQTGLPSAPESHPLRDFHLTILAELHQRDIAVTASQLASLSGMPGYDHLLELMKELEAWKLVDRPHGRRSGYRILESGRTELRRRGMI